MTALICGSIAYDTIMVFHDRFKNHILPDKVHMLNISFLVPDMRREFGGCAGNIAYNLKLLGGDPRPMATVGRDFDDYANWMEKQGIDTRFIRTFDNTYTAQAFITTDADDNQITAFHPGAMSLAHENKVPEAEGITIGIVAPDGRDGMVEHAEQFAESRIPFIFDPGQGLPMFDKRDLLRFLEQATWVAVNDYEAELLAERTGKTPHEIAELVSAYIVTRGAKGASIYTAEHRLDIDPVPAREVRDPTGCGDAFRAGLLFGLMNDMELATVGRIASLMGSIKVEHHGTQNHRFSMDEFRSRFHQAYGYHF